MLKAVGIKPPAFNKSSVGNTARAKAQTPLSKHYCARYYVTSP